MFPAPLLLALFVLGSPIFLIFDGSIAYGVVAAITAVLVAIVGLRMRPGEAGFLSSLILPVAIVAAIPALVIVIQLIPLGSMGIANPIWQSAAAALSRQILGSITVDPGATLISLVRYISVVAIAFVAAAVGNRSSSRLLATVCANGRFDFCRPHGAGSEARQSETLVHRGWRTTDCCGVRLCRLRRHFCDCNGFEHSRSRKCAISEPRQIPVFPVFIIDVFGCYFDVLFSGFHEHNKGRLFRFGLWDCDPGRRNGYAPIPF